MGVKRQAERVGGGTRDADHDVAGGDEEEVAVAQKEEAGGIGERLAGADGVDLRDAEEAGIDFDAVLVDGHGGGVRPSCDLRKTAGHPKDASPDGDGGGDGGGMTQPSVCEVVVGGGGRSSV